MVKELIFVTGNKNKLRETQATIGDSILFESLSLDLPEYQGEPLEIASKKCMEAYQIVKRPVIVEDTSLCFNAFGGLPGPYIKWFLDSLKPEGLYKMISAFDDKSGYAQCIFAYFDGATMKEPVLFDGRCPGTIVPPAVTSKFGWDPIFRPDGYDVTYAEMDVAEKLKISHRGRAIQLMKEYFSKLGA
jgi:inosine triphosphate pyrophosphatase